MEVIPQAKKILGYLIKEKNRLHSFDDVLCNSGLDNPYLITGYYKYKWKMFKKQKIIKYFVAYRENDDNNGKKIKLFSVDAEKASKTMETMIEKEKVKVDKNYWTDETEKYVKEYILTNDNDLYEKHIHTPLSKLVECVFHQKNYYYVLREYGDADAISLGLTHAVMHVLPKFDPTRNKKAFSFLSRSLYFFYIQLNETAYQKRLRNVSIEESRENDAGGDNCDVLEAELVKKTHDNNNEFDHSEFIKLFANYVEEHREDFGIRTMRTDKLEYVDALVKALRSPEFAEYVGDHGKYTNGKKGAYHFLRSLMPSFKNNDNDDNITKTTAEFRYVIVKLKKVYAKLLKEYLNTDTITGQTLKHDDFTTKRISVIEKEKRNYDIYWRNKV